MGLTISIFLGFMVSRFMEIYLITNVVLFFLINLFILLIVFRFFVNNYEKDYLM